MEVDYVIKPKLGPNQKKFEVHECNEACVTYEKTVLNTVDGAKRAMDSLLISNQSPYSVPLICGWRRSTYPDDVIYLTPCGCVCATPDEVLQYLDKTKSAMSIDQFVFDADVRLWAKRKPLKVFKHIPDVTKGQENVPVNLIDDVDECSSDPEFEYVTDRLSSSVNLDAQFSSSCTCTDDCSDPEKCECQRLTATERGKWKVPSVIKWSKGYAFKRLKNVCFNAIYECNSKCSCSLKCHNKVVSNGLKLFLEVYKTKDKGWGLRSLHDIPKGTFVCTYSGEIFTDQEAETIGQARGDEYFTDLNYIDEYEELIKMIKFEKQGYESDVDISSDDSEKFSAVDESESESSCSLSSSSLGTTDDDSEGSQTASKIKDGNINGDRNINESAGSPLIESLSDVSLDVPEEEPAMKKLKTEDEAISEEDPGSRPATAASLRSYFDDDQALVIDAKYKGNIGRFLNHSCTPNCKLQSVFIESHDPRVPVLAFFTIQTVKAFEELTWNYSYLNNQRPEGNPCKCGSLYCKQVKF